LKSVSEYVRPTFIPFVDFQPSLDVWEGYLISGAGASDLWRFMGNSFLIASMTTAVSVILGVCAGYAIAKFSFTKPMSNNSMLFFFFSQRFLPPVSIFIPAYLMLNFLGLFDSISGLVMFDGLIALPFVVIVMTGFFRDIPGELMESAKIDGCSEFQSFMKIAIPLAAPGLVTVTLLSYIFAWNEYFFGVTLTLSNAVPITVGIAGAQTAFGTRYWEVAVKGLVALFPVWILAVAIQKYLVRGLTLGAVKG
jgi:ABC-type glycerol-3-phosphate transport system permease component